MCHISRRSEHAFAFYKVCEKTKKKKEKKKNEEKKNETLAAHISEMA